MVNMFKILILAFTAMLACTAIGSASSELGVTSIKQVLADFGYDSVVTTLNDGYNVVVISGSQDPFLVYSQALGATLGVCAYEGPLPEMIAVAVLDRNNLAHMTFVDKSTLEALLIDFNSGNTLGMGYISKALYDNAAVQFMGIL